MLGLFSWQSIFFATAAVSVVTFAVVLAVVPTSRSDEHVGLDPIGTVLSALGIGALVLGIIEGPIRGWTEPLTVGALVAGAVLAVAFVRWELRTEHPLLDPRLFRYRGFAVGSASLLVLFIALFGLFLVILQYLQLMLGYSALKAAVALLPLTFLMIPISAVGRAALGPVRDEARQWDRPRGHRRGHGGVRDASTPTAATSVCSSRRSSWGRASAWP